MIVECPHCYTRVFPTSAGECPACRKNTNDTQDTEPDRTAVTIRHLTELNRFCCDCGYPTERRVTVTQQISHKTGPKDSDIGPSGIAALIIGYAMMALTFPIVPFLLFFGKSGKGRVSDVAIVRIPQCKTCAQHRKLEPIRVNSEELLLTFVVHKEFRNRNADLVC